MASGKERDVFYPSGKKTALKTIKTGSSMARYTLFLSYESKAGSKTLETRRDTGFRLVLSTPNGKLKSKG